MINASSKSGILWLSASKCKIWLMSTKYNILAIQFCVQNYFIFQKKNKFHEFGPKNTALKNLSRKPSTKSPGYNFQKKNVVPAWASSNYLPPSVHVRIFPYLYSFTPNILGWRMRMNFFQNLKFRVYNAVSLLAIGVRKRVTRYNWHGNNLSTVSICHFCHLPQI